jgi:hypothetical protein
MAGLVLVEAVDGWWIQGFWILGACVVFGGVFVWDFTFLLRTLLYLLMVFLGEINHSS